jgi:hypothetical protein
LFAPEVAPSDIIHRIKHLCHTMQFVLRPGLQGVTRLRHFKKRCRASPVVATAKSPLPDAFFAAIACSSSTHLRKTSSQTLRAVRLCMQPRARAPPNANGGRTHRNRARTVASSHISSTTSSRLPMLLNVVMRRQLRLRNSSSCTLASFDSTSSSMFAARLLMRLLVEASPVKMASGTR